MFDKINTRLEVSYSNATESTKNQEFFTLMSDAFRDIEILKEINNVDKAETFFNIKEAFKNIFNKSIPTIDLSSFDGDTAIEFIKKYNSFNGTKSKFKIVLPKVKGVDIQSDEIEKEVLNFSKQFAASEKVQQIYDEQGEAGAMDIIDLFKPITAKLANKYRDVPGFDFEFLQSEIEIGKRGLFDLIRSYDPDKGVPLAAHINTNLSRRAIEAAQRILKTDFELDVTESKGVAATETAEEIVERQEAPVEPATEIKSLRKEIGLPDELVEAVKNAVVKTFGTKLPNIQDPKFRLELQKKV